MSSSCRAGRSTGTATSIWWRSATTRTRRRGFPAPFGSAYLYFVVPRVILFRLEHSRRTLVEQVDFISAPGTSPPGIYRPGGPVALVTELCRFDFDRARGGFTLATIHPGHSLEEVRDRTGFDFALAPALQPTPLPDPDTLALIRGTIARELAEVYPAFAAEILGVDSQ
jgi:glutaconate CoA-transferase subunit B